jgi:hypothetical protein
VATQKVTIHPFPAQGQTALTITAEQISRYAEVSALISQLEAEQKAQRAELLALRDIGAEQSAASPYMLAFVDQERRNVDWKSLAIELAQKVFGIEGAVTWKSQVEQSAPVQPITQVRVKPNPAYAAGLTTPAVSPRIVPPPMARAAAFGD